MDPDLEIEFDAAEKSIEFERGLAAYFKTSADEKQRLLDIARAKESEAELYKQLYLKEQAKNQQLLQRITDLERNGTTYNVQGDYYEALNIGKLIAPKPKKTKRKITDLTNQLDLWTNPAISM